MHSISELFIEIAAIPAPSGNEEPVFLYIEKKLSAVAATFSYDTYGNMYCSIPAQTATSSEVILCAHADTVFSTQNLNTIISPDGVIRTDGRTILGADNRAAIACFLYAIEQGHAHGTLGNVFLIITKEEERGLVGALNLEESHIPKNAPCYVFDSATPIGSYVKESPGSLTFEVTLRGPSSHIKDLKPEADVLRYGNALLHTFLSNHKSDQQTRILVSKVHSGESINTSPDTFTFEGNIRSYSEKRLTEVLTTLESISVAEPFSIEIHHTINCKGYSITPEETVFSGYKNSLEPLSLTPEPVQTWGGSDVNVLRAFGIAAMNCGNGARNIHTVHEEIDSASLEKMVSIITTLLK